MIDFRHSTNIKLDVQQITVSSYHFELLGNFPVLILSTFDSLRRPVKKIAQIFTVTSHVFGSL